MKTEKLSFMESLAKEAYEVKAVSNDRSMENAPFFKEKMKKARKILSVSGLPKVH